MYKEIGSEFWDISKKKSDVKFFISGRTALDYIIDDILLENNISSVVMPSYCCETMIEPFRMKNISVRFYNVYYDEKKGLSVDIPDVRTNEVFYFMRYFGFFNVNNLDEEFIRDNWNVVLEDKTHSWLLDTNECADYVYVSCRKWDGFEGLAYAKRINKNFNLNKNCSINEEFINSKRIAMEEKKKYIRNESTSKDKYLELYSQANKLIKSYKNSSPTVEILEKYVNLDIDYIKKKRYNNAQYLINGLKNLKEVSLMYKDIEKNEVPLFVPILVKNNYREKLRKHLILNEIYCPIHWPIGELHKDINNKSIKLYEEEMSIICDQRYDLDDMQRIIDEIEEFYSTI